MMQKTSNPGRERRAATVRGGLGRSRVRAAIVGMVAVGLVLLTGVAYAAFVATTTNSGSSISAASSFGRCLVDEIKADNPVGYWRMNESSGTTLFDSAGSNNGTYQNGPTLGQPGPLGDPNDRAVTFDGSDDQAVVPNSSAFNVGDTFTYEVWIKKAAFGTFQAIVSKGTGGFWLGSGSGNDFDFYELTSGQRVAHTFGNSSISDSKWHQVAVTKNGSTTKMYVDGVDRTVLDTNKTFTNNTGSIMIGRKADGFQPWTGSLGETAIYNTALSAARIRAHYNSARCYRDEPRADSPAGVWRLGEPSGTATAFDSADQGHGSYQGAPLLGQTGAIDGDSDTAVSFDNVDDQVLTTHTAATDFGDTFTYEAWIKHNENGVNDAIMGKATISTFGIYGDNKLRLYVAGSLVVDSTTTITDSRWHHVAATKSGATTKLYIDGIDRTGTVVNQTATNTALAMVIGWEPTVDRFFNGSLDEVAVYPTALSQTRIQAHYIAGRSYRDVIMDSGPVAYYRLGETAGATAADETATNNGTYAGTYTRGISGAVAGAADTATTFDGSTGYVSAPSSTSLRVGDVFTLEASIKRVVDGTQRTIMTKGTGTAGYWLGIVSNRLELHRYGVGAIVASTTTIGDANWHHIAATKNGATVKLYIDGVDRTGTVTNATLANTTTPFYIARETPWYFNSALDEVAVYNRALSAAEITLHYDAGIDSPR